MKLARCGSESELKQLLERGAWPNAASSGLRSHVAGCGVCSERVLLTEKFRAARAASVTAAPRIAPGVLWWRAQLRRRNAAVERMERPILGAQIFALGITALLVVGFAISQARSSWQWLAELPQARAFHLETLLPAVAADGKVSSGLLYLLPGMGMIVLLGGVVVYLASEKQ